MLTTDQSTMPSSPRRRRWLLPVAVVAIAVVAGAVLAILLIEGGGEAPEDVVAQSVEAFNARDLDALEALFDPEIFYVYDSAAAGYPEFNQEFAGREAVLEDLQKVWPEWDPTTISYEVLEVDGGTVTTIEKVAYFDGDTASVHCRYEVSDDGLIVRQERVLEGFD